LAVTKWQKVESLIIRQILKNSLREGSKLPSDKEIAEQFGCSVQPVLRAMESLARKGLVLRRPGAATTVQSQPPLIDDHQFSFSRSCTNAYGHALTTRLIEKASRLPLPGDTMVVEKKAQKALGLLRNEPFLVIARLRLLDGVPRVIHRTFLRPAHFPKSFLVDHDFTQESLIDLYNANGYQIEARHTILRARLPAEEENALLKCEGQPVLEAEQQIDAVRVTTSDTVTLEYLHACYLNWEYRITNRRPPQEETQEHYLLE
jgi:DNA-binding GntR family transcriptional regulator